jgi:hypothetical protein
MEKLIGDVITRHGGPEWVPDTGHVQSMLRAVVDEAVEAGFSLPDAVRALSSELPRYAEGLTPANRLVPIAGLTRERIEAFWAAERHDAYRPPVT